MRQRSSSRIGQIAAINGRAFAAFIFGLLGWLMWPSSAEWWQFYVFSALMYAGALSSAFEAAKRCHLLYEHDKAVQEFERIGGDPKAAHVAGKKALRDAGMIK